MSKYQIPNILSYDKNRPLGYDPRNDKMILFDDVVKGRAKLIHLEMLNDEQLIKLSVERALKNEHIVMADYTGRIITNLELAQEILEQTNFGIEMMKSDIEYLKFFLSQFPQDCFEF